MSALPAVFEGLEVEVVYTGSSVYPLRTKDKTGIEEVCRAFLQKVGATGAWKIEATGNQEAKKRKCQKSGSLVLRPPIAQEKFASAIVCTSGGHLREVVFVGNMKPDVLVSRATEHFSSKRLFIMEKNPAPKITVLPDPLVADNAAAKSESFSDDDILLFLMVISDNGGHIFVEKAQQEASDMGGQKFIDHCLDQSLIEKNGTATYSLTSKGKDRVPSHLPVPAEAQPQPIDVATLIKEVAAAREILEERDKIGIELGKLKQRHRECEAEVKRSDAEIRDLEQKINGLRRSAEIGRSEIAAVNTEIETKTSMLHDPRFDRAQQTLDNVAEMKRQLAEL